MNRIKKLGMSFVYAGRGIAYCIRHERNIRIHLVVLLYVLYFSNFYNFSRAEYALLILTCAVVMALELINTAIEVVIDKVSPKFNVFAMMGKDIAAGGVLVGAIGSVIIGIILFWNVEIFTDIFDYFTSAFYRPLILAATMVISVIFISKTKPRGGNAAKIISEKEK